MAESQKGTTIKTGTWGYSLSLGRNLWIIDQGGLAYKPPKPPMDTEGLLLPDTSGSALRRSEVMLYFAGGF